MRPGGPALLLPPDHYGCGLGCKRFTGTLAAVEEMRSSAPSSPSRRFANLANLKMCDILGDEDELARLLEDMVEPLQHLLFVLQKVRRHALASSSLVTSEEMQLLESAD